MVLKDNIDTSDRMLTTMGSVALATVPALLDATLREAGAIILGKANLSEWANFRSTRPVSGWRGRGRQGLNPYARLELRRGRGSGGELAFGETDRANQADRRAHQPSRRAPSTAWWA